MSINIQKLRDQYQQVVTKTNDNQFDKNLVKLVRESRQSAQRQRQFMIQRQNYQHLDEVNFYIDKYTQYEVLMQKQRNKLLSSDQFIRASQKMFSPSQSVVVAGGYGNPVVGKPGDSPLPKNANINNSMSRNVSPERLALTNFFDKKAKQSKLNSNFRQLLQSPGKSPRNFKKKPREGNFQVQSLISQNQLLRSKLQIMKSGQQERLQSRYRQNKYQLQSLEQENTRLLRDNAQLRSQKSITYVSNKSSNYNIQKDDYLYSPYTFNFMQNDIYQINLRNYRDDESNIDGQNPQKQSQSSQYIQVDVPRKNIVYKKVGYEYQNYTEQDYLKQKANINYSIFDPNRSHFSQQDMNSSNVYSYGRGIQNPQVCLRNKLAFFRQKGLLVKNSDIEIGYKRSSPQNLDTVRVILYFNNKNADYKTIKIQYKYDQEFYQVSVNQKIRELDSFRQGRQVVEVKLRPGAYDLNSIIDIIVNISGQNYNLWLPAMFISEGQSRMNASSQISSKDIHPIKPFSNPNEGSKIIQNLKIINNNQAQFWCSSVKGSGIVNLLWKPQKSRLKIKCDQRWLHFFAFVLNQNS